MSEPQQSRAAAVVVDERHLAGRRRRGVTAAAALFLLVLALYNANGREIGSFDSQPTKFTAIELALHHRLTLDVPVARTPALAERPGFALDRDAHYRSSYPVLPAVVAGGVASALRALRLVDLEAPLASNLVSKLTASLLVSIAVVLAFVVARRRVRDGAAAIIAAGFGLGTNLWALASQTLWQTETVVAALCGVVACLALPYERLTTRRLWLASLLLGLAGAARPQTAPAIAVISLAVIVRRRRPTDVLALLPLAVVTIVVVGCNLRWFGHALGAVPGLELLHPSVHGVPSSFGNPVAGLAGLLVSPSRGILVFSPVVLVALAGFRQAAREGWHGDLAWWIGAAGAQVAFYSCYSVWWAGHTYGPRYMLDVLPLFMPLAAAGVPWLAAGRWRRLAAIAALIWSVGVSGVGAFVYPHEEWNTSPVDVDRHHERLWDWRDQQTVRCLKAGPSPQNFDFLREGLSGR